MAGKTIKTEVDSLVSLVQAEERLSVKDAAKKLGVPVATVSEWAAFLEEEGVIDIEYKFTTPFLVKKKLSSGQAAELRNKIKDEKDLFDRKSDNMLTYLNKLESEIDSLKDIFEDFGKDFSKRISDSKKEFNKLKKAEEAQEKLNKEILESKQKFIKEMADLNKQLLSEQKNYTSIYDFLYNQSEMENKLIGIQKEELELIKSTDNILNKKLREIGRKLNKKKKKISKEAESELRDSEKKYLKLREFIEAEKKVMDDFIKRNKEQEKQITALKKSVFANIDLSNAKFSKTLKEMKGVPRKLKSVMSKKNKIMRSLNTISYNENMLKAKLMDLIKRSSALKLAGGSDDVLGEIKELEKSLADITRKKSFFEKEVKKIFGMLKS